MTGGKTSSKTGSKTGQDKFMLGFRVPTTCGKKTSITTYSGEVSPPPANRTTTQCETGSETGGETGSETGGETGSETSHLVKLSLPDIFCLFSICSHVFTNNFVFTICLYINHFRVLFSDIYIFKIMLSFLKTLKKKKKIDCC